jgi:very-short-patch-repair endonuclease
VQPRPRLKPSPGGRGGGRWSARPFESVLRALAIQAGLEVVPQAPIDTTLGTLHPDLVSSLSSLVVEADSWTHHANRADHDRDCARYNALVVAGWTVLRFTYEQVMHDPEYVVATIRAVISGPHGRPHPQGSITRAA